MPEMRPVIEQMKEGEVSAPVQSAAGFHILKLSALRPASVTPFDQVKEELRAALRSQRQELAARAYLEGLLNAGTVSIDGAALNAAFEQTAAAPASNPALALGAAQPPASQQCAGALRQALRLTYPDDLGRWFPLVPEQAPVRARDVSRDLGLDLSDLRVLYRALRVTWLAELVFGGREQARQWLCSPKRRLLGRVPLALCQHGRHAGMIEQWLVNIDEGNAAGPAGGPLAWRRRAGGGAGREPGSGRVRAAGLVGGGASAGVAQPLFPVGGDGAGPCRQRCRSAPALGDRPARDPGGRQCLAGARRHLAAAGAVAGGRLPIPAECRPSATGAMPDRVVGGVSLCAASGRYCGRGAGWGGVAGGGGPRGRTGQRTGLGPVMALERGTAGAAPAGNPFPSGARRMTAISAAPAPGAALPAYTAQVDIVSIQSQVVYGYVGNNAAMPIFRRAGLRAIAVPTVILSNTPHYPTLHGGAVPLDWFEGLLKGLDERGVTKVARAVVCGYLGQPGQADLLARWLPTVRAARPDLRVHIDPVMGDRNDGLYVDAGLVAQYRDLLVPLADGMTPNHFERELLVGRPLASIDDVVEAAPLPRWQPPPAPCSWRW
ncbi:hypothetical protein G6F22_010637 [Rhizopus arrhizus]|nr:hypothetical protein G6F22_010637 [Rhizopus arrhizus]